MSQHQPDLPPPWIPGLGPRPTAQQLERLRSTYSGGARLDGSARALVTGARLFDAGYFWEAHEVWESLWLLEREVGSPRANVVRGLILLAAMAVKAHQGRTSRLGPMLSRASTCLIDAERAVDSSAVCVIRAALELVAIQQTALARVDFSPFQQPPVQLWGTE